MKLFIYFIFLAALLVPMGCERAPVITPDADGLPCVGLAPEQLAGVERDAQLARGELRALPLPATRSAWHDVFVATAHAYALDEELPLEGARVELWSVSPAGALLGQPLIATTTSAAGRYCMRAPRQRRAGEVWMLRAQLSDGLALRQLFFFPFDVGLNSASEALVRHLLARDMLLDQITPEQWLNLRTVSDTAVGLFGEVSAAMAGPTREGLIEAMVQALERDERVAKATRSSPQIKR